MISTYDPEDIKTVCPTCNRLFEKGLCVEFVNFSFPTRYIQVWHEACGTRWKHYLDRQSGECVEILKF